jgi:predicted phosphohydrolase
MKLRIVSDLHLEVHSWNYQNVGEDIVLLAGDIASGNCNVAFERLLKSIAPTPVYIVAGNHDFYDTEITARWIYFRKLETQLPHVKFLECEFVDFPTFRLCGTSLYTDFCLHGKDTQKHSMELAHNHINDFNYIYDGYRLLEPRTLVNLNYNSRLFLQDQLLTSPLPLVVMTHWAPSARLVDPHWSADPLAPYFHCAMNEYFSPKLPLWIHGHSHSQIDITLDGTRHIRNTRGYKRQDQAWNPNLIVTI